MATWIAKRAAGALLGRGLNWALNSMTAKKRFTPYTRRGGRARVGQRFLRKKRYWGSTARKTFLKPTITNMPLPFRLETTFTVDNAGYIAVGQPAFKGYLIELNSIFHPYNTAVPMPNPLTAVATEMPAFITSLLNANLYTNFLVKKSIITMELATEAQDDTLVCALAPVDFSTGSGTGYTTWSDAASGPGSVEMMINSQGSTLPRILFNEAYVPTIIGAPRARYEGDPNYYGAYNANPTNKVNWNFVYATVDGAVTQAKIAWRVSVTYVVELCRGIGDADQKEA